MENNINGKTQNKIMLKYLDARLNLMFREAKIYADNTALIDQVEQIDEDKFIQKERREEFDLLNELTSYLSFEKEDPTNTYEFKGFEYPLNLDGTNKKKTTIFVSKENALKISAKADKFESVLGVRLPVELYLLKYKDTNMPGLDYAAPEPKTADKTRAQHEQELEAYYQGHGVNKEPNTVNNFRQAYPHEKINPRGENPEMTNVAQEGYYSSTVEELAAAEFEMEHGEPGLQPGEESPVVNSIPLGQRFRQLKNFLSEPGVKKKFLKALGIVGLGAVTIGLFQASPLLAVTILGGTAGGFLAGKTAIPGIAKLGKSIKKKIKDWWLGPEITQEEPQHQEPTMTPEEINARIEELQIEIFGLEEEMRILREEINLLPDGDPAKATKQQEFAAKEAQIRAKQNEVTAILQRNDQEHNVGGPRR